MKRGLPHPLSRPVRRQTRASWFSAMIFPVRAAAGSANEMKEASILPDGRCNLWMARYEGYVLKTGFQVCSRGQSAHFAEKRSVCGSIRLDDPAACAPVSARGELFSSTWSPGARARAVQNRKRSAFQRERADSHRKHPARSQASFAARQFHRTRDPGSALVVASLVRFADLSGSPAHAEREQQYDERYVWD